MKQRSLSTASISGVLAPTWRPASELPAALVWAATAYVSIQIPADFYAANVALSACAGAMAVTRLASAVSVLRARSALAGSPIRLISPAELESVAGSPRRAGTPADSEADTVWMGRGFEWTPEHAQKLYELTKINAARLIPPRWLRRLLLCGPGKPAHTIGNGAIDGIEPKQSELFVTEKTLEGGTLVVGTTQAGKGVLLSLLVTQSIWRGDTVIIIDPKNSARLKGAVHAACSRARRPAPYVFHPGEGGNVRINPLASFTRASELASRITAVMNDNGPFTAFAWSAVNTACALLVYCRKTPTIVEVQRVLNGGLADLLLEAAAVARGREAVTACLHDLAQKGVRGREAVLQTIQTLKESGETPVEIEEAAAVLAHDPAHYAKITASLMPVLSMLTSGSLLQSLSPAPDAADIRPMTSLSQVLEQNGVLYVCLNSLPDPTVASAIGSILLADLASCAGERYNRVDGSRRRVSLFVDECSNVINRSLIEILNKGAESGVRTTCAMQTVSDLAARLGSNEEARMALGNFNSLIALRTKDRVTQDFAAETFGRTYIANTSASISTHAAPDDPGRYSGSFTRLVSSSREDIIPTDVLGKLPNCEYFASLAGGRLVKGRIPILISELESRTARPLTLPGFAALRRALHAFAYSRLFAWSRRA